MKSRGMEQTQALYAKIGASVAALLAHFSPMFIGLIALVTLDILTGIAAAGAAGKIESSVARKGVWGKVAMLGAVAGGYILTFLMKVQPVAFGPITLDFNMGTAMCGFWAMVEMISIIENAGRAGTPLPKWLKEWMARLKEQQ